VPTTNVKFVYRTIISKHSTFGHVIMSQTMHRHPLNKIGLGEEQAMNLGFSTMPIHPLGKDLEALLDGRPRRLPAGRRLGFSESLWSANTSPISGREHHLCIAFLAWIAAPPSRSSSDRHDQTCRIPIPPPSRPPWRCSITCSTAPDFRHQPRRPAVGRGTVRQSRGRPQRHVSGIDSTRCLDNLGQREPPYNIPGNTGTSPRRRR